jgi:hypothetical protein
LTYANRTSDIYVICYQRQVIFIISQLELAKFEILIMLNLKIMFFCGLASYSLIESCECFGGNLMHKKKLEMGKFIQNVDESLPNHVEPHPRML